jgi:hypothetical protein
MTEDKQQVSTKANKLTKAAVICRVGVTAGLVMIAVGIGSMAPGMILAGFVAAAVGAVADPSLGQAVMRVLARQRRFTSGAPAPA